MASSLKLSLFSEFAHNKKGIILSKQGIEIMAQISLPVSKQFSFKETVLSHGWYMLAPFRLDEDAMTLYRTHQLNDGTVIQLSMHHTGKQLQIIVPEMPTISTSIEYELSNMVMRILNMDWNLRDFYEAMRQYPDYAWLENEKKGRILISPTVWEDLAKVLMTTNTTWTQTIGMVGRLCELGQAHPTIPDAYAFPTAKRIAEMSVTELGEHLRAGYRTAYLHELAQKISIGEIDVESWATNRDMSSDTLYKAVKSLKGFGDYAAGTIVRMLGHFDKLAIDSACRDMYAKQHNKGEKGEDKAIRQHFEKFGKWRGLLMWMEIMRD